MKKLRNSWTEQTEILDAMRQTLRERQAFISEVIADNVRLEKKNQEMIYALEWADKFYQDNFDIMPVAWQGVADAIEAAIKKAGESC
jgi:hypothetical protein